MSDNIIDPLRLTYPQELWPHSFEEAVELLLIGLSEEDKNLIKCMSERGFIASNHPLGLGMYIRNQFGLWKGNKAFSSWRHPDDASCAIMSALWQQLNTEK